MRVMVWHVHGGWMDAFVRGGHDYLLPTRPGSGTGRGGTGEPWPSGVREVSDAEPWAEDVDVVVLQRPEEIAEVERLLGRSPGRDIPAIFVEHNTPKGAVPNERHPLGDRGDIPIAHVTHFNRLMWDSGDARTLVIEHGIRDPGLLYRGERPHLATVVNEPVRRWRVTGTDLLAQFAEAAPIEAYGIATELLPEATGLGEDRLILGGNLPTRRLHGELALSRVYLHPLRWTSLGLSLLEAMHLGMPVVVLDTTEAARAVPPEAGAISSDVDALVREARRLIEDPDEARARGRVAREVALERYGLARFLQDWDDALDDVVGGRTPAGSAMPQSRLKERVTP
ncbi:glycosyltransferase [Salinibacterium sp. SYSU T00001]|uniref:glycosyltransferase n=1 Tax=Homoserinimonas sedimenticola TaxID=2986805 RepID=UPI0022354FB0|nr:glycosyltransferase [Salinibacterium sedimenticola]MCW4385594.1 glycosyltransferase [Salinibacterium sedimenticola]